MIGFGGRRLVVGGWDVYLVGLWYFSLQFLKIFLQTSFLKGVWLIFGEVAF